MIKFNNGFVTNSSSTSFVVSAKHGLTKDKFLSALGVKDDSYLYDYFVRLYNAINNNLNIVPEGIENIKNYLIDNDVRIELDEDFKEIESRYKAGETVYYGKISDDGYDGGAIEAYYCHESLVVVGDDIYFNKRNGTY